MKKTTWRQIGGDMNPGKYGGIIARFSEDGETVEIREIIPNIETQGEAKAAEIGYPFNSVDASYDLEDLSLDIPEMQNAMEFSGVQEEDLPKGSDRWLALAEIAITYGYNIEPGPTGWGDDVTPQKVHWSSGKVAGPSYLREESREFRQMLKEHR